MEKIQRVGAAIKRMRPRSLSRSRRQASSRQGASRQAASIPVFEVREAIGEDHIQSDRAIALALQSLEGSATAYRPVFSDDTHAPGGSHGVLIPDSDFDLHQALLISRLEQPRQSSRHRRAVPGHNADDIDGDAALARQIAAADQRDERNWRTELRSSRDLAASRAAERAHTTSVQASSTGVGTADAGAADDSSSWLGGVNDSLFGSDGWLSGNWISDYFRGEVPAELACVACLDREADACIIPCGHVSLCMGCAGKLQSRQCPVCRLEINQIVKASRRSQSQ